MIPHFTGVDTRKSLAVPGLSRLGFAVVAVVPGVDCAFPDAAFWREVAGKLFGKRREGHTINAGGDEGEHFRVGVDLRRPARAMGAHMVAGRFSGGSRRVLTGLFRLFNGVLTGG